MKKVCLLPLEAARRVADQPTSCPGLMCPERASACDTCLLSDAYVAELESLLAIKTAKEGSAAGVQCLLG